MPRFPLIARILVGFTVLGAACVALAHGHPVDGRRLSDTTLSRVRGGDPNTTGSGVYNCSDAQAAAQGSGSISSYACSQLTVDPSTPKTCVDCRFGASDSGMYADPAGKPIRLMQQQAVNCIGNPQNPGYVVTDGLCKITSGSGEVTCAGPDKYTGKNCSGSFFVYGSQPISPPPPGAPTH